MDLVVIVTSAVGLLLAVVALVLLLARWRRNRFQFGMRAMLVACTILTVILFLFLRFALPNITHRWAVQQIYDAGGAVLFRTDEDRLAEGNVYSNLNTGNPWGDVSIVHASNDVEAQAAARQIRHLPEVTCLFLGRRVTDAGLIAICEAGPHPSLAVIDLNESSVTATGLRHLARLPQLDHLFFNTCPIDDSDLEVFASIPTLRRLTFVEEGPQANSKRFSDRGFETLAQLKAIEHLWFVHLTISDAAADALKSLVNLKTLKLSRCQISDQVVTELRDALPNCDIHIFGDEPSAEDK